MSARLQSLAQRLDCTEGQLYTVAIGLVIALPFAVFGIPPTLRHYPAAAAAQAAPHPPAVAVPTDAPQPVISVPTSSPGFGPPTPVVGPVAPPVADEPAVAGPSPSPEPTSAPLPTALPPGTITVVARVGSPGSPAGVAYLPDGSIIITTGNPSRPGVAMEYARDGRLRRQVPITRRPAGLVAATSDGTGAVTMLDASASRVVTLPRGADTALVRATVPDVPPCVPAVGSGGCEPGLQDRPVQLAGLALDRHGTLYLADAGQGIIWRLRAQDRVPQVWYSSADLDTGDGPAGLAFDRSGRLLFTTGTSLDIANPGNGGLYRLSVTSSGAPGSRTLLHAFVSGDRPGPIVVGASGTAYVIARGVGAVVSLDATGKETGRVSSPGTGPVPLDTPAGLALAPGRLLVSNEAPQHPAHWAVLAIAVNDR